MKEAKEKKLSIFNFDDTLAKVKANIIMEDITGMAELSTYVDNMGGIDQIIKTMAAQYITSPTNYTTRDVKNVRKTISIKRPLVERLEKLCDMVSEHMKSLKLKPDPYFDYKDAEGITNRITLITLRSYLGNAKEQARLDDNYKLTPELAVIFNQYFKFVKPQ